MRPVPEREWQKAFRRAGKFDGVHFESLVSHLLRQLYPGKWVRTQRSWDGKKDFVQRTGSKRRWAECKMYHERVSIDILSPTLVMALIEDVDSVLFFSFSALNANARRYLGQFASVTRRRVEIYDEAVLDRLILRNRRVLRLFFPHLSPSIIADDPPLEIKAYVSADPDVRYENSEVNQSRHSPQLICQSAFAVDVVLRNRSLVPCRGTIHVHHADNTRAFVLLNRNLRGDELRFALVGGQVTMHRLFFLPLRPGPRLRLPRIEIRANSGTAPLRLPSVAVTSLLEAPLIGKHATAVRDDFHQAIDRRRRPLFAQIAGRSGTGKSRLLLEFRDSLLGDDRDVFFFQGEEERNGSFDLFVRKLVAQLNRLPLLRDVGVPPRRGAFAGPKTARTLAMRILYDETFSPTKDVECCADYIVSALRRSRSAILIDNLQFFDPRMISFLNRVIDLSRDMPGSAVWVLALNRDFLTREDAAKKLLHRFEELAADCPSSFRSYESLEFSDEDVKLYLDHAFGGHRGFSDRYEKTTALIVERTGRNPLHLVQTLRHAESSRALHRRGDRLIVDDIDALHAVLRHVPPGLQSLLRKRWRLLGPRLSAPARELVAALAFFGNIPDDAVKPLGGSAAAVNELTHFGFIRPITGWGIRFFHHQIYLFFRDHERPRPAALRRALRWLDTSDRSADYTLQATLAKEWLGCLKSADVVRAGEAVVARAIDRTDRIWAADHLLKIFNRPVVGLPAQLELRAVTELCHDLKREIAFSEAQTAFEVAWRFRSSRLSHYYSAGAALCGFLKTFINVYFAVHADDAARPVLDRASQLVDECTFESHAEKEKWRATFMNRSSVAYKTFGLVDEAEKDIHASLSIARTLGDRALEFQNLLDWGYLYHGIGRYNARLLRHWSEAGRLFRAHVRQSPSLQKSTAAYYLHEANTLVLTKNNRKALAFIDDGIAYSVRTLSPFHEIKLLMMKVVAALAWGADLMPGKQLLDIVTRAEDRAMAFGFLRSYWSTFYVRAKVEERLGRPDEASWNLLKAFEQLQSVLSDGRMEPRYVAFYDDLAITLRQSNPDRLQDVIAAIRSMAIRDRVAAIADRSDASLRRWLRQYVPVSTFHDGRRSLPAP